MKYTTRGKICDGVIFSGMLVNAIIVVLILYVYVV
jgi:hypothetical protein